MATDKRSIPLYVGDDATWRTWAQGIDAALQAVGIVPTADTGQIDLTAAARPAAGAYGGYKVYRFNDTLQATAPVFIKVEFGSSGNSQAAGIIRWSVGQGSNGAGTLTGQTLGATAFSVNNINVPSNGQMVNVWTTHAQGRLTLFYTSAANGAYQFMHIERTRAADGAPDGDGILCISPQGAQFLVLPFAGVAQGVGTLQEPVFGSGHHVQGTDIPLLPFNYACQGRAKVASYFWTLASVAAYQEFTVNVFGNAAMPFAGGGDRAQSGSRAQVWRFE